MGILLNDCATSADMENAYTLLCKRNKRPVNESLGSVDMVLLPLLRLFWDAVKNIEVSMLREVFALESAQQMEVIYQ